MTQYELRLTYNDGTFKKERADLPRIMTALGIYFEDVDWCFAEIMNCDTDEVIATWGHNKVYGVTSIN